MVDLGALILTTTQFERQGSSSAASSPSRRFARQGLVRLNEIETEDDLNQLSAKQIKDLLAMNRVNFHGVIEKEELLKIVERLWKQEKKAQKGSYRIFSLLIPKQRS